MPLPKKKCCCSSPCAYISTFYLTSYIYGGVHTGDYVYELNPEKSGEISWNVRKGDEDVDVTDFFVAVAIEDYYLPGTTGRDPDAPTNPVDSATLIAGPAGPLITIVNGDDAFSWRAGTYVTMKDPQNCGLCGQTGQSHHPSEAYDAARYPDGPIDPTTGRCRCSTTGPLCNCTNKWFYTGGLLWEVTDGGARVAIRQGSYSDNCFIFPDLTDEDGTPGFVKEQWNSQYSYCQDSCVIACETGCTLTAQLYGPGQPNGVAYYDLWVNNELTQREFCFDCDETKTATITLEAGDVFFGVWYSNGSPSGPIYIRPTPEQLNPDGSCPPFFQIPRLMPGNPGGDFGWCNLGYQCTYARSCGYAYGVYGTPGQYYDGLEVRRGYAPNGIASVLDDWVSCYLWRQLETDVSFEVAGRTVVWKAGGGGSTYPCVPAMGWVVDPDRVCYIDHSTTPGTPVPQPDFTQPGATVQMGFTYPNLWWAIGTQHVNGYYSGDTFVLVGEEKVEWIKYSFGDAPGGGSGWIEGELQYVDRREACGYAITPCDMSSSSSGGSSSSSSSSSSGGGSSSSSGGGSSSSSGGSSSSSSGGGSSSSSSGGGGGSSSSGGGDPGGGSSSSSGGGSSSSSSSHPDIPIGPSSSSSSSSPPIGPPPPPPPPPCATCYGNPARYNIQGPWKVCEVSTFTGSTLGVVNVDASGHYTITGGLDNGNSGYVLCCGNTVVFVDNATCEIICGPFTVTDSGSGIGDGFVTSGCSGVPQYWCRPPACQFESSSSSSSSSSSYTSTDGCCPTIVVTFAPDITGSGTKTITYTRIADNIWQGDYFVSGLGYGAITKVGGVWNLNQPTQTTDDSVLYTASNQTCPPIYPAAWTYSGDALSFTSITAMHCAGSGSSSSSSGGLDDCSTYETWKCQFIGADLTGDDHVDDCALACCLGLTDLGESGTFVYNGTTYHYTKTTTSFSSGRCHEVIVEVV